MNARSVPELAAGLEVLVAAKRIPLSDQVRVSRADLDGYVADLRRAAPRW